MGDDGSQFLGDRSIHLVEVPTALPSMSPFVMAFVLTGAKGGDMQASQDDPTRPDPTPRIVATSLGPPFRRTQEGALSFSPNTPEGRCYVEKW